MRRRFVYNLWLGLLCLSHGAPVSSCDPSTFCQWPSVRWAEWMKVPILMIYDDQFYLRKCSQVRVLTKCQLLLNIVCVPFWALEGGTRSISPRGRTARWTGGWRYEVSPTCGIGDASLAVETGRLTSREGHVSQGWGQLAISPYCRVLKLSWRCILLVLYIVRLKLFFFLSQPCRDRPDAAHIVHSA